MSTSIHLPRDVLFSLLPATFEPWGASGLFASRSPTVASVARTETELGITLPPLFVEVAAACPSYGGWFGSIGDDFESPNHMLSINRVFHDEGMPRRYVLLNHGHDGHCDAWDTESAAVAGERPIVYFEFNDERRELRRIRVSATSFAEYIDALVRSYAPRCPVKSLRRRAKRVLTELGVAINRKRVERQT
jgi:hypothetical protein